MEIRQVCMGGEGSTVIGSMSDKEKEDRKKNGRKDRERKSERATAGKRLVFWRIARSVVNGKEKKTWLKHSGKSRLD